MIGKHRCTLARDFVDHGLVTKALKFAIVGSSGVAVNSVVLYLLYQRAHLPLALASLVAVELAIVNNFLINNRWTFERRDLALSRLLRFNLVSVGGLMITTGTLLLLEELGVYYLVANLLGIGLATIWNFGLNVRWTWRWDG